jgi:hypothetical protein
VGRGAESRPPRVATTRRWTRLERTDDAANDDETRFPTCASELAGMPGELVSELRRGDDDLIRALAHQGGRRGQRGGATRRRA